ncbi:hypothetical protein TanjilG_05913 [Lupinus angustifolius]|uniref:DUF3730 domain-containing protein n=1 Tax=Lupinus angustifolius TaxID=3871 RepID=A0A4P1RE20_LUPAN|nr:hypothetical protein TanjilG_05913 [Lupinus angustifolius]
MDSYSPLFDKTKLPQPSLQRHAVISIFSKLRSSPKYLNADSEPGHHVITQCLNSPSSNVVDQSVREICRLVTDSVISVNRGLLELQSALEGSDPITVPVFVKGLGFLVRFDFQKNNALWQFNSPEAHPFVKVLSCRLEVQPELLQQVCLFMLQNKQLGMVKDYRKLIFVVEHMVEAYIVVLKSLAGRKSLITEAQECAVEFLETIFSLSTCLLCHPGGHEPIFELSKRLLSVQHDLGLRWVPRLSSTMVSLFMILVKSELEHEQISMLKLLLLILKWKYNNDDAISRSKSTSVEEILFVLPVINLMSSPSKSVKGLAIDFLFLLEKLLVKMIVVPTDKPVVEDGVHYLSTPGIIVSRTLRLLWYQDVESSSRISLLNFAPNGLSDGERMHEMPSLLTAVIGVLLIHPSMGAAAVNSLSSMAMMDPKLGVPLLLTIMFYSNIFIRKDVVRHDMLLKIFEMLPSLASHSAMVPLVVQTILPMLYKDAKVWGVLLPKGFTDFKSDIAICISMAASIRDVCRKSPDRGVDLILSVSSCIESKDPVIKALGLQSLTHLCEADVIDFYTAWDVIAKHLQGYHADPIIAHSICLLLRWGAMDAEAYPEASKGVVQIIWDVVTSNQDIQWAKARISAVEALTQYEVSQLEKSIPDFKKRNLELFFSEKNPEVLKVMEDCQVKIVTDEHINRRRLVKEKRVTTGSKIEKLMAVFPQVIFSSGKVKEARELPGAALLCFTLTHKDVDELPASKRVRDVHAGYENALVEIASSLQLSRNILLALVAFQSWKGFMRRWMKAYIQSYDAKAQSGVQDTTSKAASNILKSLVAIADEAIPRAAENIALAIGALCVVLPPSVHTVKSAASKFLLEWLLQHEHEHRQWSSAISLGLISSCLHVTDHRQRYHNITGLLEVLFVSKSSLVKGACGVGLGFSCQDLLTRVEAADDSAVEKETDKVPESELLGRIVRALATMLHDRTQSSSDVLDSLSSCFPLDSYDMNAEVFEPFSENNEDLEEDIWGVAGLVLGLATSISAIYRAGELEAVIKIKKLVISWLPYANSLLQGTNFLGEESNTVLAIGSCIALPTIVTFCQRMELMDGIELDNIVAGFKELISELISVKKSGILHQSLLMASCVGAGTVISCILNEGVHSIEVDCVNGLLELFKKCYSNPFPSLVHLGGMLGAVNAMGAGAGILAYMNFPNYTKHSCYEKKEYSSVTGPLLTISVFEPYLTSLVQEMFLVAQNSDHHQLQQFASWALSFLRQHLWSKEHLSVDGDSNVAETNSKSVSHSFSEENMVLKLSLWLMDIKYTEPGSTVHVSTVIATLRCLCRAPRLPNLDWGAIIRRCMRHEAKFAELPPVYSAFKKGTLREECIQFALAHASQFDSLLNFLDELSDFSRFKTLELNLQSCLLIHLADLAKVYSSSRLEKLFGDVTNHLSSFTSYDELKSLLCISCWKGLYECLHEVSVDTSDHIAHVERCMQALFTLLPVMQSSDVVVSGDVSSIEEWSEAIKCLGKAPQSWLLDFLKVSHYEFGQSADDAVEIQKKVCAKIKLVKAGSLPLIELGKMKSYILNSKAQGLWDVLVEVVAALHHAEGSVKRQWLIDAVEISCVSAVPSTALQFLGLLSATCCKYMPFMIVDQQKVLNDLPVTLVSLLEDKNWENAAETIVSHLFSSTERIYHWAMQIEDGSYVPDSQPIDESENHMAAFLLQIEMATTFLKKRWKTWLPPRSKNLSIVKRSLYILASL